MNNPLIFIVDDDKAFNKLIEVTLKKNKYTNLKTYYSGEDCLKNFSLNPDIVVLDYNLSGSDKTKLNGLDVLDKINGAFNKATVIMVSGEMHKDAKKIIDAKFQKGMYKYIMKTNNALKELVSAIDQLLINIS